MQYYCHYRFPVPSVKTTRLLGTVQHMHSYSPLTFFSSHLLYILVLELWSLQDGIIYMYVWVFSERSPSASESCFLNSISYYSCSFLGIGSCCSAADSTVHLVMKGTDLVELLQIRVVYCRNGRSDRPRGALQHHRFRFLDVLFSKKDLGSKVCFFNTFRNL